MRDLKNILVTGGAGFIGSNFIHYLFEKTSFKGNIINVDKLTYAGNLNNLKSVEKKFSNRYFFERIDICDEKGIDKIFQDHSIDCVVHFAAESHVDRSILGPKEFIDTNILGTFNLLEIARKYWLNDNKSGKDFLFHHISTDEVFGSLGETGYFYEDTAYDPRSPYSASKASSVHLVKAYYHTYGLPITISNSTNNYGAYQFPEKLLPVMIGNIVNEKKLPVYGDGKNIRDWLFVEDHCSAILKIIQKGTVGETYNVGGENEWTNIDLINVLCEKIAKIKNKNAEHYKELITFVKDRSGHDRRYAINCDKLKNELGWKQSVNFSEGLDLTIDWYLNNQKWIDDIKNESYRDWIKANYENR